ncbi:cysteine synthase A [Sandaracinobacter sp. RS1-74]|uniref:cysteine synthase A n=1 Tax=Sandaracinobacteroides sayramensis TaxID=2913411 RepID=UPI001EDB6CE1|nr:cysteine synthase A [Sandaracinobacteroides sayramensis]MCG2840486.1 cysteine synthase A [Sandaracinobacteroides sayramensis]
MKAAMLSVSNDIAGLVGRTPLVRLKGPSERTGCDIYGKCEFLNPGGSVKDRAALWIIRDAEGNGTLKPGGIIVEGTAGNTGIGLAVIGGALGYRTVIVMPETQSQEKKDALRALGAELVLVPATSYANPGHYVHTSRRLAAETPGAIWANQFDNIANRLSHIKSTAPEILEALEGGVDGFICAAGTGGTVAGVGLGLKEGNPDIVVGLADPDGASLYNWFANGELKAEGSSVAEGIGQSRVTANLEGAPIDIAFRVPDLEAFPILYELMARDGLHLGLSSAINVAGAERLARHMGPGKRIVTILCDNGSRYLSTIWNPEWLEARGLPLPPRRQPGI